MGLINCPPIEMRKSILLLLAFVPLMLLAQKPATVEGRVIGEGNEPIPFANIAVYSQDDNQLIKGVSSDFEGKFEVSTEAGKYRLQISFLSFKTKSLEIAITEGNTVKLGDIKLEQDVNQLDEVEIVAEKSQMELKLDKRIFNVGKDLSNAGSNAADILNNIPSVAVDVEGNISLRGSQNVRVLIDGKPSTITGTSTSDVLRQFQGNMIERVEVITNPSARYDAEGEVGIINIVLKKDERQGFNGSIEAVAGIPDNYRLSMNLNFRKKYYNLFTSYGTGYNKSPGGGETFQRFNNGDTAYIFESTNERTRSSLNQNVRFGSDFFLNEKNTITVAGFYRYSDELNKSNYEFLDLTTSRELLQKVVRNDEENETGESLEASINYTRTFSKKDQKLTADLQWSESDDLEKSDIDETNFLYNSTLLQKSRNVEANRTYLAQSDYVHPIGENAQLEAGTRITLREINNSFKVEQQDSAGNFQILNDFFNDFQYTEDIYAVYMMFGNEINRFSYQLGLRYEYSDIGTELKLTDEKQSWKYGNFFPSAFVSYELENKNTYQLSYSRRINRPGFRYLLPFQNFSNQRNLWRGNSNLQPEFTDSYELGYLNYFKSGSLFSSVYYRYRTGVIDRITIVDDQGFTQRFPVNLSTENNIGLEFNGNYKFNSKSSINSSFNFYRSITKGSYAGTNLDNDVYTWNNRTMIRAELIKDIDFQAAANYRAPQRTGQGRQKSLYSIDLSAATDLMKGKATLVASVRDLLNSRKRRSITETATLYSESEFQWRARQFLLSFTYRINQKKKRNGGNPGFDGDDDF